MLFLCVADSIASAYIAYITIDLRGGTEIWKTNVWILIALFFIQSVDVKLTKYNIFCLVLIQSIM